MKSYSKIFHIFQSFFNEIQTQFGVLVKTLRSDNGREHLSNSFLNNLWLRVAFCIKLLVHIHLNKMGG